MTGSLVDRFICRREGHKPTSTIIAGQQFIGCYVTTCIRCGKAYEVEVNRLSEGRA